MRDIGRRMKDGELTIFKEKLLKMVEPVLGDAIDFGKNELDNISASCKTVREDMHKAMQFTCWSESAVFDRACLQFAVDFVVEIAQAAPDILKLAKDPETRTSFFPKETLVKALGCMASMDDVTPSLDLALRRRGGSEVHREEQGVPHRGHASP